MKNYFKPESELLEIGPGTVLCTSAPEVVVTSESFMVVTSESFYELDNLSM